MAERRTRERERVDRELNGELAASFARERYGVLCERARGAGAPVSDVEDVVQAALADLIRSFPGPDRADAAWRYLERCLRSQAAQLARRRRRKEEHLVPLEFYEPVAAGRDPAEVQLAREDAREAARALAVLSAEERAVLVLGASGFSTAEIAGRLAHSPARIRRQVTRAHRRLAAVGA